MADEAGFTAYVMAVQGQLSNIDRTLQEIKRENFTKADMETFKKDVCMPRGVAQKDLEKDVGKLTKFKTQMMSFPVIIGFLFSAATLLLVFLSFQNQKIEIKNNASVEASKTVQTVTAIEKGNK
jgi:hypothetical protein